MGWRKPIYISALTMITNSKGQDIPTYSKPVKYFFNVQPVSGDSDIIEYGERVSKMFKTLVNIRYRNKINEGDIAYLDGIKPNDLNNNYNYKVNSARPQNKKLAIYFERIQK